MTLNIIVSTKINYIRINQQSYPKSSRRVRTKNMQCHSLSNKKICYVTALVTNNMQCHSPINRSSANFPFDGVDDPLFLSDDHEDEK